MASANIDPNGDIFLPSLRLLEVNDVNVTRLMQIFGLTDQELGDQLTYRAESECEALFNQQDLPLSEFRGDFIVVDFPIGQWAGAGIVGYISIKNQGIFRNKKTNDQAVVAYIYWTCSLMSSTEETNIKRLNQSFYDLGEFISEKLAFYKKLNPAYTVSVNKLVVREISKLLLQHVNIGRRNNDKIDIALLYSVGIESSHEAHRKARKIYGCTFLTEWIAINATNVKGVPLRSGAPLKEIDEEKSIRNRFIYLWSPHDSTNELYEYFRDNGSDIRNYNENGSNLNNYNENSEDYECPSNTNNESNSSGYNSSVSAFGHPAAVPFVSSYGISNNNNENMRAGYRVKNKRSKTKSKSKNIKKKYTKRHLRKSS